MPTLDTFPLTAWSKTKHPPSHSPKSPQQASFPSPFSLPRFTPITRGFPLKFPHCLALYWLSPIVVYHQHIWQIHSWFLPCTCCWLENKRGFIEPSLYTHLLPCSHSILSLSAGGGLSLDFSFNMFGSFHAQKEWGRDTFGITAHFVCTPMHPITGAGQGNVPLAWQSW